jgi:hypothetical protein
MCTEEGKGTSKIEYQTNRGYQEAWPSYIVSSKQNGPRFNMFAVPAFFVHYLWFSLFVFFCHCLYIYLFVFPLLLSSVTAFCLSKKEEKVINLTIKNPNLINYFFLHFWISLQKEVKMKWTLKTNSHMPCRTHTPLCSGLDKSLSEGHGCGMARAQNGRGMDAEWYV